MDDLEYVEYYDGEPIVGYRAHFSGAKFWLDPSWAREGVSMGRLPIVVVACNVVKPNYDDIADGRIKDVTFIPEEVQALQGDMRGHGKALIRSRGKVLELEPAQSRGDAELERIASFLAERGINPQDGDSVADTVIRTLKEYEI